jgi:hypothetical protein
LASIARLFLPDRFGGKECYNPTAEDKQFPKRRLIVWAEIRFHPKSHEEVHLFQETGGE